MSTRRSAHKVALAKDRVRTLQIIDTLGQCVLNLWLADSRIGGRPDQNPPILVVLPGKIRLPANDQQRITDQQYLIFLRHEPRGPTHAELLRPNLTERLAILLKILHGEVVDFVLL